MYNSILELPSQVRNSLSDDDQAVWMRKYNACDPSTPDAVRKAKRDAWFACKDLPSSFSFHIIASVDDIDKDREIIDVDSIKKNLGDFIDRGGNVQWEHQNYNVACIWGYDPIEDNGLPGVAAWGNVYGGDGGVYDQMRKSFVNGKNSLSVAGEADLGHYRCDERGCYTKRNVRELMEISLCGVPANRHARMLWYNDKASLTKSAEDGDDLRLRVQSYDIHKDWHTCPILSLKKALADIGYANMHAATDGVNVAMTKADFDRALPLMEDHGVCARWMGDHALLNYRSYAVEKAFKDGYASGSVAMDGKIVKSDREHFADLFEKGLLEERSDGFYLTQG